MKSRIQINSAFILLMLACLFSSACGIKMSAAGRVVDAQTGMPIEGAAVAIKWVNEKIGPPGLPTPRERLGTTETLTDGEGEFTIPRYLWRTYYMGVYKEGYICWDNETRFISRGYTTDGIFQKRSFDIHSGMEIQLDPMPVDISSELRGRHAHFTVDVDTRLDQTDIFYKAIKHEKELHRQILRGNK